MLWLEIASRIIIKLLKILTLLLTRTNVQITVYLDNTLVMG